MTRPCTRSFDANPESGVWLDSVLDPDEDGAGLHRRPVLVLLKRRPGAEQFERSLVQIDQRLEIGRAGINSCHRLVLPCPRVSRNHACIFPGESWFEVHDLESVNGTYVGGSRVGGVRLAENGSMLFIGSEVMVLRFLSSEAVDAIEADQRAPLMQTPTLNGRTALLHGRLRSMASGVQPILVSGSPGSGLTTYARAVHRVSGRRGPFIVVEGSRLAGPDAEEWFFGRMRPGDAQADAVIAQALTGTLFIDGLDEAAANTQEKLVQLLDQRTGCSLVAPRAGIGAVRLIASTRRPLTGSKQSAPPLVPRLREIFAANDVRVPSLVHRKEDLGMLFHHILTPRPLWTISHRAWLSLCLYDWPGNLVQVSDFLQRLLLEHAVNDSFRICRRHLPPPVRLQFAEHPVTTEMEVQSTDDTGRTPIDSDAGVVRSDLTHTRVVEEFAHRHRLSQRQAQIVARALRGRSSKEIAADLNIDYRTVGEHWARLCEKAGAVDRHQLVAKVVDLLIEMSNIESGTSS